MYLDTYILDVAGTENLNTVQVLVLVLRGTDRESVQVLVLVPANTSTRTVNAIPIHIRKHCYCTHILLSQMAQLQLINH